MEGMKGHSRYVRYVRDVKVNIRYGGAVNVSPSFFRREEVNVKYELTNFCEIDAEAVKSYCAIHEKSLK